MSEQDNDQIRALTGEVMSLRGNINAMSESMEDFKAKMLMGFPSGDLEGHRRYHQNVIEWQELRNKMVREALIKMAQATGLAALGWLGYAVWAAIKYSVLR